MDLVTASTEFGRFAKAVDRLRREASQAPMEKPNEKVDPEPSVTAKASTKSIRTLGVPNGFSLFVDPAGFRGSSGGLAGKKTWTTHATSSARRPEERKLRYATVIDRLPDTKYRNHRYSGTNRFKTTWSAGGHMFS